ncbi:MAG: hypothetical protein KAQ63_01890, partial [Candidatus Moranbacteria bacterium]|nr:hypothetical protein [Candidatus Moranbacteria bacterium]
SGVQIPLRAPEKTFRFFCLRAEGFEGRRPQVESWRATIESGPSPGEEVLNENELKATFEFSNSTPNSLYTPLIFFKKTITIPFMDA